MLNRDSWAKTYVEMNGKNFDFTDKFRYQECGLDTKLVHINDARKNFDFELLFNDISEGIKAEKKGQKLEHRTNISLDDGKIVRT